MKVGDKVTVVVDDRLVQGRVVQPAAPRGAWKVEFEHPHNWVAVPATDEGITWCHGHVTERNARGKALLTAYALSSAPKRRARDLGQMSEKFIHGEITEAEFKNNLDLFDEDIANGFH